MGIKQDSDLLRKIMCFTETARLGKINDTASKSGMKQSNLSKTIIELEKEIGFDLFIRHHNGVQLTENGKSFYQLAANVEKALYDIKHFNTSTLAVSGDVRLWTSEGIGASYVASILNNFYEKYPDVRIHFTCSLENPQIIDQIDVGILYQKPTFKDAVIFEEHFLRFNFFASKSYLATNGSPKNLEDMLDNHKICTRENFILWPQWKKMLPRAKHVIASTNASTMLFSLVKSGVAIGFIPTCAARNEPDLIPLKQIDFTIDHPFWIVSHKNTKDVPKVRALVNYIIEVTRNL